MSEAAGLNIDVVRESSDAESVAAEAGHTLLVHYTGTLADGTVFDTTRKPGRDFFTFKLGDGNVIPGWEQGLVGMKVGEVRKLTIGPDLAYGEKGVPGTIPPSATLTFEIELLDNWE